jgi:two-component system nitrogen regulation response regulator GlnG
MNDSDTAIEAMKMGAYDYLLKPLDVRQVKSLVDRALETRRLMNSPVKLHETEPDSEESDVLVGRSPKMLEVYKQIGRVAAQDVTVLIRGESGSGKELIARALYQHSHRNRSCFMAVNCAALTDTLLESELFGHEKGAFTGADRRHIGRFEQCNGGTIFLDEVGDMSPATQSKVLRLLQEQKFERVGGHETISVDVRLISATNRDLDQMIEDNEFRLDLFHRLNGFEIQLPPLREREGDLKLLLDHFLKRFNVQLGKNITGISPEALQLLENYSWPGNIRELQGAVRRAMLMATGPTIVPELLPKEIVENLPQTTAARRVSDDPLAVDLAGFVDERLAADSDNLYQESLHMLERYLLTRVLRETQGNQSKAARRLGITRGSLRNKMRDLGIQVGQVVEPGE